MWGTKAPIKDGFDGAGVCAGRLRSTGLACGFQPPEVLSLRMVSGRYMVVKTLGVVDSGLCMAPSSLSVGLLGAEFALLNNDWSV